MSRDRLFALLLIVGLLATAACGKSWDWKQADLDRNSLNLGLFRGADTGAKLAGWVRHGTVEASRGTTKGGDLVVVVRYEYEGTSWTGRTVVETACYRFTPDDDGSTISFGRTDCP